LKHGALLSGTIFVSLSWRGSPPSMGPLKNGQMVPGSRLGFDYLPQKTESYTGIASIHHGRDQAVTESMGPITDREFENLGPSDIMIARTRRRLLRRTRLCQRRGGAALRRRSGDLHHPRRRPSGCPSRGVRGKATSSFATGRLVVSPDPQPIFESILPG
jgi:hypothetical protein